MKRFLREVLAQKGGKVHGVSPSDSVIDAVNVMNEHRIGAVVVMSDGKPVGIFTERDVMCRILAAGRGTDTSVSDVMTREPVFMTVDRTVQEAMAVMTEKRVRHMPILKEGALVGLVSIGDLTKWVTDDQEHELHDLYDYIAGRYPG